MAIILRSHACDLTRDELLVINFQKIKYPNDLLFDNKFIVLAEIIWVFGKLKQEYGL